MNVRTLVVILLYVLAGLGYILKYQVTEKRGYSFENALIEKSKSSTRKKVCLVERKHYIINLNVYLARISFISRREKETGPRFFFVL